MSTVPNIGAAGGFVPVVQPDASIPTLSSLRRFTVDEYYRLAESGIIRPDERIELLEGVITMVPPIGGSHSTSCDLVYRTLLRMMPPGLDFSNGRDVELVDSVPVPDGLVLRGSIRDFVAKKASGSDVALIVEVAESSLLVDRGNKQRIYAAAGIPEYWIVNLAERKLEIYRRPVSAAGDQPAKYESVEVFTADQSVDVVFDGAKVGSVIVHQILP
jgi:Uma2 family endonuclease